MNFNRKVISTNKDGIRTQNPTGARSELSNIMAVYRSSEISDLRNVDQKNMLSFAKVFLTAVMILFLIPGISLAQTADSFISGSVYEAQENKQLQGVEIIIEENGHSVLSDENGAFRFSSLEKGTYTLLFAHPEYESERKIIQLPGKSETVNIHLVTKPEDESKQANFTNSIGKSMMAGFGDYSVEEAMARFPGVQVNREGEVNIRGAGFNSYYLTINGQRMGTNGLGNRSYDLGSISTDMIRNIELIKVITPDMAADGLAGVVNLETYQPLQQGRNISGGLSGGLNPVYVKQAGATGRAWFRYSEPVSEDMSLSVNLSYQQDQQAYDRLDMDYMVVDFGAGNVDVLNSISPGLTVDERMRLGGSLQLDYQPSENSSYFLRGFINTDDREITTHSNTWFADGDWDDQNTAGSGASYLYDMNYEDIAITQFLFDAGGTHELDRLILNYRAGWSLSSIERSSYLFPFEATGTEFTVDFEDRTRPEVSFVEEAPIAEDMDLETMTYIVDNHYDNKISADINAELPFEFGSVKIGGNALLTDKDANDRGAYSEYLYTYRGFPNLDGFDQNDYGTLDILDSQYQVPWTIDTDEAVSFFQSSVPNMRLEEEEFYTRSGIRNYFTSEQIWSGFGMANLEFGNLELIAGVRLEHTNADHEGRIVEFSRFGQFEESRDTTVSASYTNMFPHAQLVFNPVEESTIRLAYSKTIARPDFNLMAPFNLATPEDTSFFKGNPDLEPITSDNIDLFVDYRLSESGLISVGAYYKMMSNFIVQENTTVEVREGEYASFDDYFDEDTNSITADLRTYTNGNEATVYGFEVTLQQGLNFLPGALGNLGIYGTYTWSDSDYETSRNQTTAFPGQSTHAVNAAVDYTEGNFSAQLSYHWTSEALSMLADRQSVAPAAASGMVFLDRYEDGAQRFSANAQYKVTEHFMIYGNLDHLLMNDQIQYAYDRSGYPTSIYKRSGPEFNIGVQLGF